MTNKSIDVTKAFLMFLYVSCFSENLLFATIFFSRPEFFSFARVVEVAIFTCGRHFEFAKSNLKLFQTEIEMACL